MKYSMCFFYAIVSILLLGCQERIDVIVNAKDGSPIVGAIVSNTGEQVRKEEVTDKNGMAKLDVVPNHAGVYRIDVTYLNRVYWGSVRESDNSHRVIFTPELDIWKTIGSSGEIIRSEKSHHTHDIP